MNLRARVSTFAAAAVVALACTAPASAAVLYSGVGSPDAEGWLGFGGFGFVSGTPATPVTVNTTLFNELQAGYSNRTIVGTLVNPAFPRLDRNPGFALDFTVKLNSEASTRPERAGFSVLLLAHDRLGIELGFHGNQVFAQTSSFTVGSSVALDTLVTRNYRLQVGGSAWSLSVDGGLPILAGSVVDYSGFGSAPYTLGDMLFLGDNTTSANASFTLGRVALDTVGVATVPLPAAGWLVLAGLGLLGTAARRSRRS